MIENCKTCTKSDVCAFLMYEKHGRLYEGPDYEDLMHLEGNLNCGSWKGEG